MKNKKCPVCGNDMLEGEAWGHFEAHFITDGLTAAEAGLTEKQYAKFKKLAYFEKERKEES